MDMRRRGRHGGWLRKVVGATLLGALCVLGASAFVEYRYARRLSTLQSVPKAPVAIVFGAGLTTGGEPSRVLSQRVDAAIELYRAKKVQKLLLSGDNTDRYHDETRAMRRYALERGVPAEDVVGDDAGVSTYDTVLRARDVFGVDEAILVTQRFHLPRALFLANTLGLDAWGVSADPSRDWVWRYELRELLARAAAVPLVLLQPPPRVDTPPRPLDAASAPR